MMGVWKHFGTLVSTIKGENLEIFGLVGGISSIGWTNPGTLDIICLIRWRSLAMIGLIPTSRSIKLVIKLLFPSYQELVF